MRLNVLAAATLRRAELVAFGVPHDPPVPGGSLVDLADTGCPQSFQPGDQLVETAGLTVDVDVQAVPAGLGLGHVLNSNSESVNRAYEFVRVRSRRALVTACPYPSLLK